MCKVSMMPNKRGGFQGLSCHPAATVLVQLVHDKLEPFTSIVHVRQELVLQPLLDLLLKPSEIQRELHLQINGGDAVFGGIIQPFLHLNEPPVVNISGVSVHRLALRVDHQLLNDPQVQRLAQKRLDELGKPPRLHHKLGGPKTTAVIDKPFESIGGLDVLGVGIGIPIKIGKRHRVKAMSVAVAIFKIKHHFLLYFTPPPSAIVSWRKNCEGSLGGSISKMSRATGTTGT